MTLVDASASTAVPDIGFLSQVTPLLLTYNEAENIGRTLEPLRPFREVIVVDSGSTDATLDILRQHPNVRVVTRTFDSHADQWNFALSGTGIQTEWVLALDADYVLTRDAFEEIANLAPAPETRGFRANFRFLVLGRALAGTLYPPVVVLYRHLGARYRQDGHTQRLELDGKVETLRSRLDHDDRKSLGRWLWAQDRYATLEASQISTTPWRQLGWPDRLRQLIVVTPWLVPLYCLTYGRGVLDGPAGLYYALQRGIAEAILCLRLIEYGLKDK